MSAVTGHAHGIGPAHIDRKSAPVYTATTSGNAAAAFELIEVMVACDVTNPLTGPLGASRIYGPQKGADDLTVALLEQALTHLAEVFERELGKKVDGIPGAGAGSEPGRGSSPSSTPSWCPARP